MKRMTRHIVLATAAWVFGAGVAQAEDAPKMKMTTPIPHEITTPDRVDTRLGTLKFFDGLPDAETVQKVYDNLDFQRGIEAFLNAMPGASANAMRNGMRGQGVNNQTVLIFENLPGEEYTVDCFTDRHGDLLFAGPRSRDRVRMGISFASRTWPLSDEIAGIIQKWLSDKGFVR